jgi:hypothetical protein
MEQENTTCEEVEGEIEVPASPLIRLERNTGWGGVEGLEADELLDEAELERWLTWQEWGPIMALPVKKPHSAIRPTIDESGHVDWGAFGTVDFERMYGPFDKVRYKADILREKLKDVLITLDIVKQRLPAAGYLALKLVQMGIIDSDHITNDDVRAVRRLRRRVQELRDEITDLTAFRRRRWEAATRRALARLTPG